MVANLFKDVINAFTVLIYVFKKNINISLIFIINYLTRVLLQIRLSFNCYDAAALGC